MSLANSKILRAAASSAVKFTTPKFMALTPEAASLALKAARCWGVRSGPNLASLLSGLRDWPG